MINNTHTPINILLVEDDEIDVEMVQRGLKKQNIPNSLQRATTGAEALEILRGLNQDKKITQPCLMLVDINMPVMNGIDFLKAVREDEDLRQNVAFMLTTSSREKDVSDAYNLNAAGYFLKDNFEELMKLIDLYSQTNKFPTPEHKAWTAPWGGA